MIGSYRHKIKQFQELAIDSKTVQFSTRRQSIFSQGLRFCKSEVIKFTSFHYAMII